MLTLDWSREERTTLVDLDAGAAVLHFDGCELRVLPNCRMPDVRFDYAALPPLEYWISLGPDRARRVANVPRLAGHEDGSSSPPEISAIITTAGRHRARAMDLRRAPLSGDCEGATHVATTIDVGLIRSDSPQVAVEPRPSDCASVRPGDPRPPPRCDEPWSVGLTALDPRAPWGSPCPTTLHWNGLQCDDRPDLATSPTCTVASPEYSGCDPHWPPRPLALADAQDGLIPERLTTEMVDAAMASAEDELGRCGEQTGAPPDTRVRLQLSVDGPTGTVTEARALGPHARSPLGHCVARAVAGVRFETTQAPRQRVEPAAYTR